MRNGDHIIKVHFDKERENPSFSQVVLQCCKNSTVEDNDGELAEDTGGK